MANVDRGTPFSVTASVTGTNATATQAGTTGAIYYITDVSGSAGTTGTIQILGGSAGSTVLWANSLGSGVLSAASFRSPIAGNVGIAVSCFVQGQAGPSKANISGYIIYTQ